MSYDKHVLNCIFSNNNDWIQAKYVRGIYMILSVDIQNIRTKMFHEQIQKHILEHQSGATTAPPLSFENQFVCAQKSVTLVRYVVHAYYM